MSTSPLNGLRVWLVVDPAADSTGWQQELARCLRDGGAAAVDVVGTAGFLGLTARSLLEQGAELISRAARVVLPGGNATSARDELARARPDVIVTDQPQMLGALDAIRDTIRLRTLLVGLVAGWEPRDGWERAWADGYVAPDDAVLAALRRPWTPDAAIVRAGPTVGAGFARPLDRDALRAEFGFATDHFVALVDACGLAPTDIDTLVYQISLVGPGVVPVFYHGRDRAAADALRNAARAHRCAARMFGWVASFEEYVAAADLVVVGAGSETLTAATALGVPALGFDPALGITAPARNGALVVAPGLAAVGELLARVAGGGVAPSHAEAAAVLRHPEGAADVARAIATLVSRAAELQAASARGGPRRPATAPEAAPAPAVGPFESIGAGSDVADASLSRAAARDRLALLIREERRLETENTGLARERDRWLERARLAAEQGADDLRTLAEGNAAGFSARLAAANDRLARIAEEKDAVRRRVAGAGGRAPTSATTAAAAQPLDPTEQRFRELEQQGRLDALRRAAAASEDAGAPSGDEGPGST